MVPGFNTDFKYRGETYHVQTEDNGVGNPVIVSLLYHKGAILASRRTSYRELAGTPGFEKELMGLMKNQHKDLMRGLLAGDYDSNGAAPAIAGSSGEHPAAAAAAAASVGVARPKTVSKPPSYPTAALTPPGAPAAPESRLSSPAPRAATLTLDEAIRCYLEEFAAAAATVH